MLRFFFYPKITRTRTQLFLVSLILASVCLATTGAVPMSVSAAPPTLGGCPVFPADNIWNAPATNLQVNHTYDSFITNTGGVGLHPDFGSGTWQGAPIGIPFVVVPQPQALLPIHFDSWPGESDPGPNGWTPGSGNTSTTYPFPTNAPVEGGANSGGDQHVIVLQQGSCKLYETYYTRPQNGGTSWLAANGAVWDLNSNALRPSGWTSADAAGLPILPGLARYSEVQAGSINHALRFTVSCANGMTWPATHQTSGGCAGYPPMGQRFRLKSSYVIPSNFSQQSKVILQALKTYGMIVADNGSNWYISGAPDPGWADGSIVPELSSVKASMFEAVDSSPLMVSPTSGQVKTPPNTAPGSLVATVGSSTQINLSWTDTTSNETGFYIERRTGPGGSFVQVGQVGANVTTFSDTGLMDGVPYYYQVRAFNTFGTSPYSSQATATTPFLAPTGLTATPFSTSQINLAWVDNSQGETGYFIERRVGTSGPFTVLGATASNATSFQDTGLQDGTTYYYQIRAFNSYGNSAYSNQTNATTLLAIPATPASLSAWATSTTQANLSWIDTAHNEAGFIVERSPDGTTGWVQVGAMTGPNVNTFTDSGLTATTTYYYRVKAHNGAGDSGYSNVVSITTTVWQVTVATEDGLGTTPNSLSNAFANATAGQTILISVNVSFNLQPGKQWTPNVPNGVNILGNCGVSGPTITIDGTGLPSGTPGLILNHNNLVGLKVTRFPVAAQIKISGAGRGNHLNCVDAVR